jgi:hypothetical protein
MTCDRCKGWCYLDRLDDLWVCLVCGRRTPVVPFEPLDKPKDGMSSKWDTKEHGTG